MIMKCTNTCTHDFQDERYGKGNRVFNLMVKNGAQKARCTVCENEQNVREEKQ